MSKNDENYNVVYDVVEKTINQTITGLWGILIK